MTSTPASFRHLLATLAVLLAGLGAIGPAEAAVAQRTFVASHGDDANACTLVAPCRSFAAALARTNAGGEVIVLDSAGYGPATIAQSVSIIAPAGVYAGISVFSGNGVTITTPGITVTLRGLAINGQGGDNGIYFFPGTASPTVLHVDACAITGLAASGIVAASGQITISDTVVRDNAGTGIFLAGVARARLTRVRSEHNGTTPSHSGLFVTGDAEATVSESVVATNLLNGAAIQIQSSGTLTLARSTLAASQGFGILGDAQSAGKIVTVNVESSSIAAGIQCVNVQTATGASTQMGVARSTLASGYFVIMAKSDLGGTIGGTITSNRLAPGDGGAISATGSGTRLLVTRNVIDRPSTASGGYSAIRVAGVGSVVVAGGNDISVSEGLDAAAGGTILSRGDNIVTGTITGNVVPIGGH